MAKGTSKRGFVVAALLLGIFVAAMDNTIVATATGNIVAHLGGLEQIVWITAAYMLTEMAGMPIFGKLSDMYGRKRFFMFGLAAFLMGSILCGTAHNMTELAIYRAIQGVGGGALMPIAFTIIFDVVPPEEQGKFSGLFGAVFGLASIFGPLLGAYITEHWSWRIVFFINVPIGVIAFVLILFAYRESARHGRQAIDWLGIFTLVPGVTALTFALEFGGQRYAWNSAPIVAGFALAALLLAVFFVVEMRAKEPVVSLHLFRKRTFAISNVAGIVSGSAYIVAVVWIPIYVQGVRGGSPVDAGLFLLPMMVGSSVTAAVAGRWASRAAFRTVLLPFAFVFGVGIALLLGLRADSPSWLVLLDMVVVGLGIGPFFSVTGMAAMSDLDAQNRGAGSSTNNFVRELGMTVGIVIYGAIQKHAFAHQVSLAFRGVPQAQEFSHMDPRAIMSPQMRHSMPDFVLTKLVDALNQSIHTAFVWDLIPCGLTVAAVILFGHSRFRAPAWPQARYGEASE
ncbi:MDR family MFS transporter [Alicyclobacillus vulcanalis]|uniref:Drug resistance transporter, EmrB/QacA subfamily n=1 Tax=Alicyclobacillus vulcanalis TaxID=252246 RepID=A0A1N7JT42_9BACL|nr:MDR family MFS transporter [Alicyclobacillus vulcanalis]SIS52522.1 drug resistance transporter, EmrB/QacA subfamily [Alicyclobacillus vulcanalis]